MGLTMLSQCDFCALSGLLAIDWLKTRVGEVPKGFRVDLEDGTVTCDTCHDKIMSGEKLEKMSAPHKALKERYE